jgi:hypothetical protein
MALALLHESLLSWRAGGATRRTRETTSARANRVRQNRQVTLVRDGHVLYRLQFWGRPDLDSESFDSNTPYNVGETFNALELDDNWIVVDVLYALDGEPDTLKLTIQEAL